MQGNSNEFSCGGRSLTDWLGELVADDRSRRVRAAEAIQQIRFQPSSQEAGPAHGHAHLEAFDAAVRDAMQAPGFDARGFVAAIVRLLGEPIRGEDAQEAFAQSLAASFVFLALRDEILLAPEAIRTMLGDPRQRWNAIQVIERLGPKAEVFADDLVAQIDAGQPRRPFDAPDALAAVIRDDPSRIRAIVGRLDSPEPAVAEGAADVLVSLGRRAAELAPECVEMLASLAQTEDSPIRAAAITAMGRVAQGRDEVVDLLLELSRSADGRVAGAAITALGDVGRRPERVVPRLIDALEDYEERDSDWLHYSAHERVVRALQAFGDAAAPAVPALAARVRRADEELDRGAIETLGRLGPIAESALPILERLAEEEGYTAEDLETPVDLLDEDFLPRAVVRIRETRGLHRNI